MNNMTDGKQGSAEAGSPIEGPTTNTNDPGSQVGQPQDQGDEINYEESYKELEQKLGQQGAELGEYRTFFQSISPLLEKLDEDPVLVEAIMDGKIDKELAIAVSEGRATIEEAKQVSEAHKDVKKELGEKEYESTPAEEITKLVNQKVDEMRAEFEQNAELRDFEESTQKFIENTSDFAEYAEDIDEWLDHHDITDIEVAYYAVKGQMSEQAAQQKAEEEAGERAKEVAQNATGGGVTAQFTEDGTPLADKLISGTRDPNIFG
jgi:hypothetical protein